MVGGRCHDEAVSRRSLPSTASAGSGSQHALRLANMRRLCAVLRSDGAMTQTQLARATGLSNATVSNLVRVMSSDGSVRTSATTSSGRRAVLVHLVDGERPQVAIGLDIGRQHVRLVACTPARERLADVELPLVLGHEAAATIAVAATMFEDVLDQQGLDRGDVLGCGVGIPAPIDRRTGRIAPGALLPEWTGHPVRDLLERALGVPVELENDANLGALAELSWGRHGDVTDLVFVKVATGIGAGIVVDSRLHRGRDGRTGEIGHTNIAEYGPVCRCGGRGCLEAIASSHTMLGLLAANRPHEPATLDNLVRLALEGDPGVVRIIEDAGLALGRVLGSAVNLLNPQLIVISGPITAVGEVLVERVRQGLARFTSPIVEGPAQVVTSALGGSAEALGGCELVLRGASATSWDAALAR